MEQYSYAVFFLFFTDWYDGGNGPKPRQLGQLHE